MPIQSKVFIQTLQKSQDRHNSSFSFEFNNKNTKKVFGANLPPPPNTIKLDLPLNTIRVKDRIFFGGGGGERGSDPNFIGVGSVFSCALDQDPVNREPDPQP